MIGHGIKIEFKTQKLTQEHTRDFRTSNVNLFQVPKKEVAKNKTPKIHFHSLKIVTKAEIFFHSIRSNFTFRLFVPQALLIYCMEESEEQGRALT